MPSALLGVLSRIIEKGRGSADVGSDELLTIEVRGKKSFEDRTSAPRDGQADFGEK